jgi:hypothetical protein
MLVICGAGQTLLFAPVADKGGFNQHRRHGRSQQNVKGAWPDTKVFDITVLLSEELNQGVLNFGRQAARFVDFRIGHQVEQNQFQIADFLQGGPVFPGRHSNCLVILGKVQVIGLDAVGLRIFTRIGMNGNKQVGIDPIGQGGPLLQRQKTIIVAGHDDLATEFTAQAFGQHPGDCQSDILLANLARPDRPGVLATVAGIDNNPAQTS